MKNLIDHLELSNIPAPQKVTNKPGRKPGSAVKVTEEVRKWIISNRYFTYSNKVPSYRETARQFEIKNGISISHECIRQFIQLMYDNAKTTPAFIQFENHIANELQGDFILYNEALESIKSLFGSKVEMPCSFDGFVEVLNNLMRYSNHKNRVQFTPWISPSGVQYIVRKSFIKNDKRLETLGVILKKIHSQLKKESIIDISSANIIVARYSNKDNQIKSIIYDLISNENQIEFNKEYTCWFSKHPKLSGMRRWPQAVAILYRKLHDVDISHEELIKQLSRLRKWNSLTPDQMSSIIINNGIEIKDGKCFSKSMSESEAMSVISKTERFLFEHIKEPFTFETLLNKIKDSDIMENSLRVYMSYSPILKLTDGYKNGHRIHKLI